ncbi:MAG TPA: hypothetical protein PKN48_02365 [Bacteroidales bacterium]|nr:hypothetical protein [Bacteroidales bacterium]
MKHLSEETIMGLADATLTLSERTAAEAHIAVCSDCCEQYNLYKSLDALLSAENILQAPPAMTNRVMQQVELHQKIMLRKAQSRRTLIKFSTIMFVFMLALVVLAFVSGAAVEIQTPAWISSAKEILNSIKMPHINLMYLFFIIPVVFLLFAERIIVMIGKHRLAGQLKTTD